MNYEEAIKKYSKNKVFQFMCKHESLDVDYSPKTMECFVDIVNNDDNSYCEETDSYNYEEQSEKDVRFFEGETVKYGDYQCYIRFVDDDISKLITYAKKEHELLGLHQEYRRLKGLEKETNKQYGSLIITINKIERLEKELEEME